MYQRGRGVAKDVQQAMAYYTRACDAGNTRGCASKGEMYQFGGDGVEKDYPAALSLLR